MLPDDVKYYAPDATSLRKKARLEPDQKEAAASSGGQKQSSDGAPTPSGEQRGAQAGRGSAATGRGKAARGGRGRGRGGHAAGRSQPSEQPGIVPGVSLV